MARLCSLALCFSSLCIGIPNKKLISWITDRRQYKNSEMFICVYPLYNGLYVQLQPMYDVSEQWGIPFLTVNPTIDCIGGQRQVRAPLECEIFPLILRFFWLKNELIHVKFYTIFCEILGFPCGCRWWTSTNEVRRQVNLS